MSFLHTLEKERVIPEVSPIILQGIANFHDRWSKAYPCRVMVTKDNKFISVQYRNYDHSWMYFDSVVEWGDSTAEQRFGLGPIRPFDWSEVDIIRMD